MAQYRSLGAHQVGECVRVRHLQSPLGLSPNFEPLPSGADFDESQRVPGLHHKLNISLHNDIAARYGYGIVDAVERNLLAWIAAQKIRNRASRRIIQIRTLALGLPRVASMFGAPVSAMVSVLVVESVAGQLNSWSRSRPLPMLTDWGNPESQ